MTIINTRKEEQQKAANLIALKTSGQEEDTKVLEEIDLQEVIPALDMVINKVFFLSRAGSLNPPSVPTARPTRPTIHNRSSFIDKQKVKL